MSDTDTGKQYKTYLAGPMTGIKWFNITEFNLVANVLRGWNYEVVNPAEHDIEMGFSPKCFNTGDINNPTCFSGDKHDASHQFDLKEALVWDLTQIATCDFITLLPGWERSSGVRAELALAFALNIPIYRYKEDRGFRHPTNLLSEESWLKEYESKPEVIEGPIVELANAKGSAGEVRKVSATGGEKGSKAARFDLVPIGPSTEMAELYGSGAQKYAAHNWRNGYDWSLSYAAAQRHMTQFWNGEDRDPEMNSKHVINAAFHMFALAEFMDRFPEYDDRFTA